MRVSVAAALLFAALLIACAAESEVMDWPCREGVCRMEISGDLVVEYEQGEGSVIAQERRPVTIVRWTVSRREEAPGVGALECFFFRERLGCKLGGPSIASVIGVSRAERQGNREILEQMAATFEWEQTVPTWPWNAPPACGPGVHEAACAANDVDCNCESYERAEPVSCSCEVWETEGTRCWLTDLGQCACRSLIDTLPPGERERDHCADSPAAATPEWYETREGCRSHRVDGGQCHWDEHYDECTCVATE